MTTGIVGEYEGSPTSSARRRILVAGTIGTAIEWYDFFIYGLIAPLVFDQLFFPKFDQLTATIAVFATFAVGFLARPLGGLVFGHFGDRLGRKSALLCTLVMMGLATMAIGLLPTYERAGAIATTALVVLRFIQGFAIGGESTAAILMALESSLGDKRGFSAAVIQAAGPVGVVLASFAALAHLLANAAKFTPPGGTTTVSVTGDGEGSVVLTVADTGCGIEPALLPRLFQPFTQGDRTLDRRTGGLGIGLALVKHLVELHGGEVRACSSGPDQGAEFAVRLPLDADGGG